MCCPQMRGKDFAALPCVVNPGGVNEGWLVPPSLFELILHTVGSLLLAVWCGIMPSSLDWPPGKARPFPGWVDSRIVQRWADSLYSWDCLAGGAKWPREWVTHLVMGQEHQFWGQKSWVRVSVISSYLCGLKKVLLLSWASVFQSANGNNLTGLLTK